GQWQAFVNYVKRVNAEKGTALIPGDTSRGSVSVFSPDSRLVAFGRNVVPDAKQPQVRIGSLPIFELNSMKQLAEFPTGPVLRAAFAPDNRTVAVLVSGEISLWDVAARSPIRRYPTDRAN